MENLISVIIPVYNTEAYLEKCVNSVISQTYKNLQIIIVDDGSNASTTQLCDELALRDSRIMILHKKNGGLSSARNAGIELAKGEYLTFLDSDDYVSPSMYEELISVSSASTIGISHFVRVDENGVIYNRFDPHITGGTITPQDYLEELLSHTGDVSACTKLFHQSIIGKHRFDETKLNEDLLFMVSLLDDIEQLSFTGRIGYYYLCRTDSISSKYGKAIVDMVDNSKIVFKYTEQKFPKLLKRASRFVLFQHMAYLLLIPKNLRISSNQVYTDALKYLRNNFCSMGLWNKYLSVKQKCIIIGLLFIPNLMADIYQRRH